MTPASLKVVATLAWSVLLSGTLAAQAPSAGSGSLKDSAAALRARGLELGFNLDHPEALVAFREAIAAEPNHPAAYRLAAATLWTGALFDQGAVTAEDFLGQAGATPRRPAHHAELSNALREALQRADAFAAARARTDPTGDAEAAYQKGAAHALLATYTATVEGSLPRSLGPARRAYREHQRALDLDPHRRDAGLIVGMYRYSVSILPGWSRLLAHLAGFGGGRERGLRLIEDAAGHPGDAQANARFSLIVIYQREARYDDALRVIGQLQRQFPRNRLLWLEAGCAALRAGRPAVAREALEHGLAMLGTDTRPRAFGELARWRYHYGVALAGLNQIEPARRELGAALLDEGHDWVRGRAHLELGKLADRSGDSGGAATEFRTAVRMCDAGEDTTCARESRDLLGRR